MKYIAGAYDSCELMLKTLTNVMNNKQTRAKDKNLNPNSAQQYLKSTSLTYKNRLKRSPTPRSTCYVTTGQQLHTDNIHYHHYLLLCKDRSNIYYFHRLAYNPENSVNMVVLRKQTNRVKRLHFFVYMMIK